MAGNQEEKWSNPYRPCRLIGARCICVTLVLIALFQAKHVKIPSQGKTSLNKHSVAWDEIIFLYCKEEI
jgi:hypothetical protein